MRLAIPFLTAASALALALALPDASEAGPRRRGGDGARARSGESHKSVTRSGPGGESRTWQKDTQWQRGAGQAQRDTAWTDGQGRKATRHDEATRTETGHERSTTWTDRQGRSATRDATVTKDPEAGTRSKDVTWTGPEGGTRTRDSVTQKTEDGRTTTTTTTVTRPDGAAADGGEE